MNAKEIKQVKLLAAAAKAGDLAEVHRILLGMPRWLQVEVAATTRQMLVEAAR